MSSRSFSIARPSATPADDLRRAAYRVADAARQVEDAMAYTPATAPAWADLRWAHARLSAVLRLAPDADSGPVLAPQDVPKRPGRRARETAEITRDAWPIELEAAGWACLDVKSCRRWVPPGSDGRRADRVTLTEAGALRGQAVRPQPPEQEAAA